MKQISKIFAIAIVMVAFTEIAFGQVTATANATATVVAPLTISATSALDFGSISASTAGTVIVSNASVRSKTGGVVLVGAVATAAAFDITGVNGSTIVIGLPTAPITLTSGGNTMDIITLTSTIAAGNYVLAGGAVTLNIGGTLDVATSQAAGAYSNATDLTVTVNYQ
jgi:hypothetical protein